MYPKASKANICGLFGISRQAWYDSKKRQATQEMAEVFILTQVKAIRKEHKYMGAEKIYNDLESVFKAHHIKCGRDKFYTILRESGLLVRHRRRGPKTTNSNHHYRKHPNLIRDLEPLNSGKLWVSDITYIRTERGFVYLSLVTDAYSRKIVGWCLWPNLSSHGALNALRMAIKTEEVKQGLIHHSDRGIQYCCHDYVNYLKGSNISISMTENGDPYENAIAERVNGILKTEYELSDTFVDYTDALEAVKVAVYKYNYKRPHRSNDFMTPAQAHQCFGKLKKRWKNYNPKQKVKTGISEQPVLNNRNMECECSPKQG